MDSLRYKIIRLLNKTKSILSVFYYGVIKARRGENTDNARHQADLDKKLVYSLSKSKIPNLKQIKYIKTFLSTKELRLLRISFLAIVFSLVFLGVNFYKTHLQIVPMEGGEYTEGLVGFPQYINPLYADFSDVDKDISSLIFSSLFKNDSKGYLVNDLAESYEISEDNKAYTVKIRTDVKWHNDTPLTVDDILFTFNAIKDNKYNSPLKNSFTGAEIEKLNDSTIKFTLAEPYAAFLELLTFGIMPQDLWYKVPPNSAGLAELNLRPVGSGPYKIKSLTKDKAGQLKSYHLMVNNAYYGTRPKITTLSFKFFTNFTEAVNALNENSIDGISYLPKVEENNLVSPTLLNKYKINLPQLTAVFFNQKNNSILADKKVRRALTISINKNEIIKSVLDGEAGLIDGPILPNNFAYNENIKKYDYNADEASKLLDEAGWKIVDITEEEIKTAENEISSDNEEVKSKAEKKLTMGVGKWRGKDNKYLIIKLTTLEKEENSLIADTVKNYWESLNIKVNIELIPANTIQSEIINPRNFEALIYSQMVGHDPDLYAFWHSSQVGELGLNLSNYANKDVDKLLEDARLTTDVVKRKENYKKFQEIITEDIPAIFLYSPLYTYAQNKKINGFNVESILTASDRFSNISDWYIKTGKKLIW